MDSDDKASVIIILGIFVLLPVLLIGGVFLKDHKDHMANNHTLEMKKLEVEKAKWEATTRPAIVPVAPMVVEKN